MDALTASFDADAHAAAIREQGFTVIEDFVDEAGLAAFRASLVSPPLQPAKDNGPTPAPRRPRVKKAVR